ncbi:MAG: tetratricopeptide repeat protein [Proteobacteria bacterium]|nr:tetratricopeptide repeat protein [Pseudomonadota bacterium]
MVTDRRSFLSELRRRNVLRAAVLYVGATWALAQGISQLTPALDLPEWTTRWFLIAAIIGFPFWLAFAWFYEFTPRGIKRESEVAPGESIAQSTARKLDFAIIGVLAIAVVLLASGYFVRRQVSTVGMDSNEAVAFNPPKDSLVVLPFKNLGGDPKQAYFSDGITEELTGALGENPALRVIAWDTASTLRDAALTATDVGKRLNVANVVHGSILRDGDDVRITAELVNAVTGYQLWAAHYDGSLKDIFRMQDQVSEAIARALEVRFAQSDLATGRTTDPRAHELVLRGRQLAKKENAASLAQARDYFQQAIALDPEYAEAHALLSRTLLVLTEHSNLSLAENQPTIRAEAQKAVELDPRNADAWVAVGNANISSDPPDLDKARSAFRKALALDPSNVPAHIDYGIVLPLKAQMAQYREATLLDPANEIAWNNLAVAAQDLGDPDLVVTADETLLKLDPKDVDSAFGLAFAYQQLHRNDKIAAAFDLVQPSTPVDQQQVDTGRLVYGALADPASRPQALTALDLLATHRSNPEVAGNLLQLYLALGENSSAMRLLEDHCPAQPVGCNDLAVNPMYQPLRSDPGFRQLAKKYTTTAAE